MILSFSSCRKSFFQVFYKKPVLSAAASCKKSETSLYYSIIRGDEVISKVCSGQGRMHCGWREETFEIASLVDIFKLLSINEEITFFVISSIFRISKVSQEDFRVHVILPVTCNAKGASSEKFNSQTCSLDLPSAYRRRIQFPGSALARNSYRNETRIRF